MQPSLIFTLSVIYSLCLTLFSVKYLQILQLSSYKLRDYLFWLKGKGLDCLLVTALLSSVMLALSVFFPYAFTFAPVISLAFYLIFYKIPCKVKFTYTKRAIRLTLTLFAINLVLSALAFCLTRLLFSLSYLFQPLAVLLSAIILSPLEAKINARFVSLARRKLESVKPITVAITGSYGKTTAKNILAKMLETTYSVCATPKSYNTEGGICKTVNQMLKPTHKVFIAELGARRVGEIKALTRLISPDVAIITAVGNQHLGTFGSPQNVAKAKYELIENLPCGGVAYFNGDNEICKSFYDGYDGNKIITGKSGRVWYDNVVMSGKGLSFDLHYGDTVEKFTTRLLGSHIPSMICLCSAVALNMSVPLNKIKNVVNGLQPVAHRLEIIYNVNDVVIDDSYNSNEQGFVSALSVLSYYSYLIKVIITPGVVELGDKQYEINYELGKKAGKVCDYVIVLGENAKALKSGAIAVGVDQNRVIEAKSIDHAVEYYKKITGGKAVLFENDLPDNY